MRRRVAQRFQRYPTVLGVGQRLRPEVAEPRCGHAGAIARARSSTALMSGVISTAIFAPLESRVFVGSIRISVSPTLLHCNRRTSRQLAGGVALELPERAQHCRLAVRDAREPVVLALEVDVVVRAAPDVHALVAGRTHAALRTVRTRPAFCTGLFAPLLRSRYASYPLRRATPQLECVSRLRWRDRSGARQCLAPYAAQDVAAAAPLHR